MIHDRLQMKPNQPALNFWAKHHISIATMSDPLNRCVLCGKERINVVIDTVLHNKLHICSSLHCYGPRGLLSFDREQAEKLDYGIIFKEIMLYHKMRLLNINALTNINNDQYMCCNIY